MDSKIVFVVGFVKSDGSGRMAEVPARLWADLKLPLSSVAPRPQGEKKEGMMLAPCRSFRTAREQLASIGMHITKGYINSNGKAIFVFDSIVEAEDAEATVEFDKLFHQTGWSAVEYNNEDGSTVYAVHGATDLADMVRAEGQVEKVARDWSKTEASVL